MSSKIRAKTRNRDRKKRKKTKTLIWKNSFRSWKSGKKNNRNRLNAAVVGRQQFSQQPTSKDSISNLNGTLRTLKENQKD